MPTKNLDKYSRVKPSIAFYSKKNNRQMFCESRTEVGALYELEFDPTIRRYQTQPDSFSYRRNGALRRYTPDILCQDINGGFWFEEVKSWSGINKPSFQEKHQVLTELFDNVVGVPLRLRVSAPTYTCSLRGNLEFLYRYLGCSFSNAAYSALASVVDPVSVENILSKNRTKGVDLNTVYAGIAQGLLAFNKRAKISPKTTVWGANHA